MKKLQIVCLVLITLGIASCSSKRGQEYIIDGKDTIACYNYDRDDDRWYYPEYIVLKKDLVLSKEETLDLLSRWDLASISQKHHRDRFIIEYSKSWVVEYDKYDKPNPHGRVLWEINMSDDINEHAGRYPKLAYCYLLRVNAPMTEEEASLAELRDKKHNEYNLREINNYAKNIKTVIGRVKNASQASDLIDIVDEYERILYLANEKRGTSDWKSVSASASKIKANGGSIYQSVRNTYAGMIKKSLWIDNIEVRQSGTTITYIAAKYIDNKNIKYDMDLFHDLLKKFGFKKACFKYHADSSEGWYYTIE